jgi:hypothetical protein
VSAGPLHELPLAFEARGTTGFVSVRVWPNHDPPPVGAAPDAAGFPVCHSGGDETFAFTEEVVESVGELLERRLDNGGERCEVVRDLGTGGLPVWETVNVHGAGPDAGETWA